MAAPGQDPLARGWTRGGEIYMYVPKDGRSEKEVSADFVADMASPVEPQQPRCAIAAARRRTAGSSGDGSASSDSILGGDAARADIEVPPSRHRQIFFFYKLLFQIFMLYKIQNNIMRSHIIL